jgi:hypothetical protein
MIANLWDDALLTPHVTPVLPLGAKVVDPSTRKVYRYAQLVSTEAGTVIAGNPLCDNLVDSSGYILKKVGMSINHCRGIATAAWTKGYYGLVQTGGKKTGGIADAGGAIAAGELLTAKLTSGGFDRVTLGQAPKASVIAVADAADDSTTGLLVNVTLIIDNE